MSVKVINYCKKKYRPDSQKIVTHILERIPEKFLVGLGEVQIFDIRKKDCLGGTLYVRKTDKSKHAIIEIYMDHPTFSGFPVFVSRVCLNAAFLFSINEHIQKYLKPRSKDKEILSFNTKRIYYNWMYLGAWGAVFRILHSLFSQSRIYWKIVLSFLPSSFKDIEKHKRR